MASPRSGSPPDASARAAASLRPGCVLVFEARTDRPPVPIADLEAVLSADERERADRFRFERDRRRSVMAWGLLRMTLGGITGAKPDALRFHRNAFGKPHLEGGPGFNLSHSGDHVLIAVAPEGRLGVDVEIVRPLPDVDALAAMVFSPDEIAALAALTPSQRERGFFRLWTRKEAIVKAIGEGLSLPLDSFSVSAGAGTHPILLRLDRPGEQPDRWSLWCLPLGPDAEAAVAWDHPGAELQRYDLLGPAPAELAPLPLLSP